jgi:hypothetical protein
MLTREIPRSEWREFLRDFTRFHQGWTVSVDIFSQLAGAQKEVNEMAFAAILAEARPQDAMRITLMFGVTAGNHLTHTIAAPVQVSFECLTETEILRIEDESGTTILLGCHRRARPARAA